MISLLLIASFLLHVVLIIAIYQLFQQMEQIKQAKNTELDTMLTEFMQEIKTENEALEQLLKQQEQNTSMNSTSSLRTNQKEIVPPFQQTERENSTFDISPLLDQQTEVTELSEEGKILQLDKRGYSNDEIAKQLNKGKTEVALILKLQQQLKQNT